MKYIFLIVSLFFLVSATFAQNSPCPNITVTAPSGLTPIGESMTFTANISGIDSSKLKYEWTVSNGEISSGQGTKTIKIEATKDMAGQTVTATIEIAGLLKECGSSFSGDGEVNVPPPIKDYSPIDDYGKMAWRDEKLRLQPVIDGLKNFDNSVVVFMIYASNKERNQWLKLHLLKIGKYLTEVHKIPSNRILFTDTGEGEYGIRIYIFPMDMLPKSEGNDNELLSNNWRKQIDLIVPNKKKTNRKTN